MCYEETRPSLRRCFRFCASLGSILAVISISVQPLLKKRQMLGMMRGNTTETADMTVFAAAPATNMSVPDVSLAPALELPPETAPPSTSFLAGGAAPRVCDSEEISDALHSVFQADAVHAMQSVASPDPGGVSKWFRIGLLRSCCAAGRCQRVGGDVFLAFLEGRTEDGLDLVTQPLVHDLQNGSYTLLVAADSLLPSGTYTLRVYLHQALNRSVYQHLAQGKPWPLADPSGKQSALDTFDLHLSSSKILGKDLRSMYVHLVANASVAGTPWELRWSWPGPGPWTSAMARLPPCPRHSGVFRREGGFWLQVGGALKCSNLGVGGCGELGLLRPDPEFHHVYVERSCYYPVRNGAAIQSCLKKQKVVLLGDSTTQGLLSEALVMWSEKKPYKSFENKSDVCSYKQHYEPRRGRWVGQWTSPYCDAKGSVTMSDVTLGGRAVIHSPQWSYLRSPQCKGLGNLADRQVGRELAKQLNAFSIVVLHSCDHDLCNKINPKPKLLQQYRINLKRLAKLLQAHAKRKRIIWLSCAAQGNLAATQYFTQTQLFKWRMDRLALEMCRENGWEFVDVFSLPLEEA